MTTESDSSTNAARLERLHAAILACGMYEEAVEADDEGAVVAEADRVVEAWRRQGWQAWAGEPQRRLCFGLWRWRVAVTIARPLGTVA